MVSCDLVWVDLVLSCLVFFLSGLGWVGLVVCLCVFLHRSLVLVLLVLFFGDVGVGICGGGRGVGVVLMSLLFLLVLVMTFSLVLSCIPCISPPPTPLGCTHFPFRNPPIPLMLR